MSSYLNIYLVPKGNKDKPKDFPLISDAQKPLLFCSFSRNHPIYSAISEAISPKWAGNEDVYTELTTENLGYAIEELNDEIDLMYKKIHEYELHANGNQECIEQLIEYKEMYKDMLKNSENLEFIKWFVSDVNNNYTDFEKVLCNIS